MIDQTRSKVLVVEDDVQLRFVVAAHLRASGFEVIEARDGLTAIALAKSDQPNLIIMDLGIPKMDGVSATAALKADPETTNIPVIMLTGRSRTQDVVRGLEAGAQEYLCKPFEMTELLARVQTVYNLAAAHRNLDRLNHDLEKEVDIKTKRLQILYEFMRDLNRATGRESILDLTINTVESLTEAKRISLLIKDEKQDRLVCERAVGIEPEIVNQISIKPVEGIAGQVYSSGKTLSATAIQKHLGAAEGARNEPFLSTPIVSTSLQTDEGIFGVLNITEKKSAAPFSDEEIECVRSIADAAAIAMNNEQRRTRQQQSVKVLLTTVGHLAEYRDEETTRHIERVSIMSRILAEQLARKSAYRDRVSDEFIEMLVQAAPLHDLGKVGIPDEILTKPGKLTDEEFQIMKTHTDIGRRVLSMAFDPKHPVPLLTMCIEIAHAHHERWDGRGYPRRLAGEDIPLCARIIALVDAYDAITSERRYSKARPHSRAVEIMKEDSGKHFDPVIVEAFLECQEDFMAIARTHREESCDNRKAVVTSPTGNEEYHAH